jgi:hypothetical protein
MTMLNESHQDTASALPHDATPHHSAAESLDDSSPPVTADTTPALKRLGPLPFGGGTFPLMGFFASVYEHISAQASVMLEEASSRRE